jgi:hypothetical protein
MCVTRGRGNEAAGSWHAASVARRAVQARLTAGVPERERPERRRSVYWYLVS